ncbi:uncharacterized protein LOC114537843 [Dendronephthya gigantea]|uniref:uncharacterized protein LOC114537843 n=1 Tax=Dendronephthya gigantea TaxID=151771 RepID=UPI00106AB001|nr:uncharacterized protein LOC114537843 [Dendronephthya gigantea]
MEPETLDIKQEDGRKCDPPVERTNSEENSAGKFIENSSEIDVLNVEASQPFVAVPEPLVPDLTLFSYEVQQGYRIFHELKSDQYKSITYPFVRPVDVEGLNLWDYHARIETPMSFTQIEGKFKSYDYQSITAVISDMRLILENCYRYNGSTHWISKLAHKLEKILDQKLALLNRSLREKVTLRATMAFRRGKDIAQDLAEESVYGCRRRRSGRMNHMNGINPEEPSSLMNHLMMEEEENQKEIKRIKEKERREANEALMVELGKWENEMFTTDVLRELRSIWEIPAIGSFLWLFQPALNLPELNFTEFEYGLIIPNKSQQMAWILTSLLVTPSQRKSIHKKAPMKFKVWERKLKERLDIWYLAKQEEELQTVARQIGLNPAFFDVLGDVNPLETKSYIDLTLHQRVLILKVLCDECLDYHPQLRDFLGNTDTTPYNETYLGYDAKNSSYLYFPIFDATDIRIYKQDELPALNEWYRKWVSNSKAFNRSQTTKGNHQSKSRKRSSSKSSKKSKETYSTIEPGFGLACGDVESLRELCEKFSEKPPPPPSRKKSVSRPTRKRCEKELHKVLSELLEELGKSDAKYSRSRVRGMMNLMKDWKSVEDASDSGNELENQDETEDVVGEDIQTPRDVEMTSIPDSINLDEIQGEEGAPLLSMVTRSRKRKFLDYDDMVSASSSPLSEVSKSLEGEVCDENPDSLYEVKSEKRPYLDDHAIHDSAVESEEIRDGIVYDIVNDLISKVSGNAEVVINGVDNDGYNGTSVTQNDVIEITSNGVDVENTLGNPEVSGDSKGQQLITSNDKNGDTKGHKGEVMDIKDSRSDGILLDKMTNGSLSDTNKMPKGHNELQQNHDASEPVVNCALNPNNEACVGNSELKIKTGLNTVEMQTSVYSSSHCPETQGINGSITCVEGTDVYINGQNYETKKVCNGDYPLPTYKSGYNPSTKNLRK